MKKSIIFILIFIFVGCGVSNVVNRGEYITETSVKVETPRKELLARFGSPIDKRISENGDKIEVFRCPQGDTTSGKAIKGTGMLVADILTLGLTEVIFTPVSDGEKYVTFEVTYDERDTVKEFKIISK